MSYGGVAYLQTPATIVNEALDMMGVHGKTIGDITDGTPVAEAARRNYGQLLRQLLRTAHWDFARKRAKLTLLGDATGNSTSPAVSSVVECPWAYAYAWPVDAVMGRWLPWNPTNAQPASSTGVPLTTGVSALVQYPLTPGRFLVSSSDQYPVESGLVPWDQLPDLQRTEGLGPTNRKIILTDCCDTWFVYTRLVPVIEEWDSLFRQAMVTMLALALVPIAIDDPKEKITQRNLLIPIAKNTIADARVANGQESGMPQGVDHTPVWISARNSNWWNGFGGFGGGAYSGYSYYPWDSSMQWCGSVF